ncbi:MAG: hypothetical protein ACRELV_05065 [Longimicrobiales bacterium]
MPVTMPSLPFETLHGPTSPARAGRTGRAGSALPLVVAAGLLFAVAGWTDVLLLWVPLGFGNPEWEFATTSTLFDALPLATIGVALLALAARAAESSWPRRVLAALCGLIAVALVGAAVLYALSAVVAWNAVDPGMRPLLLRSVVKTPVLAVGYITFYAWLAWWCARSLSNSLRQDIP